MLANRLHRVRMVEPMGRQDLDCAARVRAIEREACATDAAPDHRRAQRRRDHGRTLGTDDAPSRNTRRTAGDAARLRATDARGLPVHRRPVRRRLAAGAARPRCRSRASSRRAATTLSRNTAPWHRSPPRGAASSSISATSDISIRLPGSVCGRKPYRSSMHSSPAPRPFRYIRTHCREHDAASHTFP